MQLLMTAIALIAPLQDAKPDADLQGTWVPAAAELGGEAETLPKDLRLTITGDHYSVVVNGQTDRGTLKPGPKEKPKALDIVGTDGPNKGRTIRAIYEVSGGSLKICYALQGPRPSEFKTQPGDKRLLVTYKRAK